MSKLVFVVETKALWLVRRRELLPDASTLLGPNLKPSSVSAIASCHEKEKGHISPSILVRIGIEEGASMAEARLDLGLSARVSDVWDKDV